MRVILASCLGVLLSFTVASLAFAQGGAVVAPPIVNWSYLGRSSTFEEGYLRGSAAVVQSAGQANYMNSIAAVNYQEATRKMIENQGLYIRNNIKNREMVHQFRERYRPSAPTQEEWQRVTEASLPDRLSSDQFDPVTGKLIWPNILRSEEYQAFRERIDAIYSNRTPDNSGDGSPSQRELASLIDGMKMLLKSNINTVTLSQYASAKWFLKSVDYEAQFPLQSLPAATDVKASDLFN